jgi:acyl-CoA-binding protein
MALNDDFEKAIKDIQGLPEKPSNQDQLALYALFKQAKFGDVTGTRPPQFELFDRAKFDGWTKVKGLSSDEAMQQYIDKVYQMLEAG